VDSDQNSGSVMNVIVRSGTNVIHGSLYELHRDSSLDAAKWSADTEQWRPEDRSMPIRFQPATFTATVRTSFPVEASSPGGGSQLGPWFGVTPTVAEQFCDQ